METSQRGLGTLEMTNRLRGGPNDLELRNQIVVENMALVRREVRRIVGHLDEDLVQEGCLGLMRALEKFNPDKSAFSNYARWWIRAYVLRALQKKRLVHVSHQNETLLWQLDRYLRDHPSASADDLVRDCGLKPGAAQACLKLRASSVSSLDDPLGDDTTRVLGYTLPSMEPPPDAHVFSAQGSLTDVLTGHVEPRRLRVLRLHAGEGLSLEETAKFLAAEEGKRVTRQRVGQLFAEALEQAREALHLPSLETK